MCDKAMHEYVGTQDDPLRIVRGGVFGGTPAQIEVVAKVYEVGRRSVRRDPTCALVARTLPTNHRYG
jgi:hypothetical protein